MYACVRTCWHVFTTGVQAPLCSLKVRQISCELFWRSGDVAIYRQGTSIQLKLSLASTKLEVPICVDAAWQVMHAPNSSCMHDCPYLAAHHCHMSLNFEVAAEGGLLNHLNGLCAAQGNIPRASVWAIQQDSCCLGLHIWRQRVQRPGCWHCW